MATAAAQTVRVVALGVRIDLVVHGVELVDEVRRCWSRCVAVDDGAPAAVTYTVGVGNVLEVRGVDHHAVMQSLTNTVTHAAIARRAGQLVLLHGAAVSDSAGRTVILVAGSGMGKTTATRVLGRRFGYVTDETAGVDARGLVSRYPKPLSIIGSSWPAAKDQVSPDALDLLAPPPGPLRVAAVAMLDRRLDTDRPPEVRVVPNVAALGELTPQTSSLAALDRPLHTLVGLLDLTGGLRRIVYSEATDLGPVVQELIGPHTSAGGGGTHAR